MTYRVRQQEIWDTYTLIEADSEQQAIALVKDGQGDMIHSEYNRQSETFDACIDAGMKVEAQDINVSSAD